jgi:predicted lipoprotein with Yx(FWY)xxD motif
LSKLPTVLVVPAVVLVVAGCGSSNGSSTSSTAGSATTPASSAPTSAGLTISSTKIAGLGSVLVNAQRHALYMFAPDKRKQVTCVSTCAAVWPPVFLTKGQKPVAAGAVKQSLLGSDPDPAGGRVITYGGWPLYTYVTDTTPGGAAGQALNINGGLWYVISPSGKPITKKP